MLEVNFLFGLAFVWILFAVFQDLKTREIANWLNYSLIIFALVFRFFYSLFEIGSFDFFYQGVLGFLIFFVLSNLFYYLRMFAGGDAKLLMALGAVLPFSYVFLENVRVFAVFLFCFLLVGAVYGILVTIYFGFRNFKSLKKEFMLQFKKNKRIVIFLTSLALVFLFFGFFNNSLIYFSLLLFFMSYFYLYVKSVDKVCMVRRVKVSKVTVGDWLYKDVKVGNKIIKSTWDGLEEDDIKLLRKKKKFVYLRYGIQYAPVFFISFILMWLILKFDLLWRIL